MIDRHLAFSQDDSPLSDHYLPPSAGSAVGRDFRNHRHLIRPSDLIQERYSGKIPIDIEIFEFRQHVFAFDITLFDDVFKKDSGEEFPARREVINSIDFPIDQSLFHCARKLGPYRGFAFPSDADLIQENWVPAAIDLFQIVDGVHALKYEGKTEKCQIL